MPMAFTHFASCSLILNYPPKLSSQSFQFPFVLKEWVSKHNKKCMNPLICVSDSIKEAAFVVKANETRTETLIVEKPQLGRFQVSRGYPTPFGATVRDGGVNFSIYSGNAISATLCLITLSDLWDVSENANNKT